MRTALVIVALCLWAGGCAGPGAFRAASDPIAMRDAVAATGDTRVLPSRRGEARQAQARGCTGLVSLPGLATNPCPDDRARSSPDR